MDTAPAEQPDQQAVEEPDLEALGAVAGAASPTYLNAL